jgi:hypothetical protein
MAWFQNASGMATSHQISSLIRYFHSSSVLPLMQFSTVPSSAAKRFTCEVI